MAALSQSGFKFLKTHEGYKTTAYHLKNERYCTVGFGHYGSDVICGKKYTDSECQAFFAKDSQRFNRDVNKVYSASKGMTQNMYDAMFSFAYNHGNISSTTLGKVIAENPRDFKRIQQVWENSYVKGPYEATLRKRRREEFKLYCGSAYQYTPLSSSDSGETYGTSDDNENNSFLFTPNTEETRDYITNDVDWNSVANEQTPITFHDDDSYGSFNIVDDSGVKKDLGVTDLTINTTQHKGPRVNHNLIEDESIKPAIAQDEKSEKFKEDVDTAKGTSETVDTQQISWPKGVDTNMTYAV